MLTIINGTVLKGQNLSPVKENILIDEGIIVDMAKDLKEGELIDASGCIVSPSFLNAHTHIGDSIIKDQGDGLSLGEMVKPPNGIKHLALEKADDNELIESMKSSMWDMLNSGTTHFIDYREGGIEGVKLLKEASSDIPINPIILGRDSSFFSDDYSLREVKTNLRRLLKYCDGVGLSGFGEISDEVASLISGECRKQGKISSIHVAESEDLQFESLKKTNKTEVERAIDANFNQIVHFVYPKNNDIPLLVNSNTNLTIAPRANATLNLGFVPLVELLKNGLKPLIGSDNIMLNTPNILRDLEFTLKIMRALYNKYLSPKEILKLATTNPYFSNEFSRDNKNKVISLNNKEDILFSNINKSVIGIGQTSQLIISKQLSKNPYLSLINRCETKNILNIINKDKVVNCSAN